MRARFIENRKKITMISLKKALALALTAMLSMSILSSCGGANTPKDELNRIDNPQDNGSDEVRIVDEESNSGSNHDNCYEEWTFDEAAAHSTDIVEAESTGKESFNSSEQAELIFKIEKSHKGSSSVGAEICVVPYVDYYPEKLYEEGKTYLLLLQRFSTVYREYDKYLVLDEQVISSSDAGWDSAVAAVKAIPLESDKTPTYSIGKYTDSDKLSEIIDFANRIFVVTIDSVMVESTIQPTTVYNCTVIGTVKGMPENDGKILITLFNDTVEVGGEYVCMLSGSEGSIIYTLAAEDGVYPVDSSATEIKNLLNEAQAYTSAAQISVDSDTVSDDEDIITDSPLPD